VISGIQLLPFEAENFNQLSVLCRFWVGALVLELVYNENYLFSDLVLLEVFFIRLILQLTLRIVDLSFSLNENIKAL